MKHFSAKDFPTLEKRYRTMLINSLSGFKSVNLVGTTSKEGIHNLSVVSSIVHLGANPALMGFVMRPITVTRDTYLNIMETGFYTLNHLTSEIYQQAHQASARYPADTSEFDAVGLTSDFKDEFKAPYVKESTIQIGLTFKEKIDIQLNGTVFIIGEIREIYVPEDCIHSDGYLDIQKAGTIACSGLDAYHTGNKLKRLSYAKTDRPIKAMDF